MFRRNTYRLRTVTYTLVMVFTLVAICSAVFAGLYARTVSAAPSTYLNFQARLKNGSGGVVPDGNYNIEFKIYDAASGGSVLWTETRTGGNRVRVANGYLTVNLGSVTAFPSTIDWSEQRWITMNIGGTGSPSWDGEMTNAGTRMILTAVPYAFKADKANTALNVASDATNTASTNSSGVSIQSGNATGTTSNSGNISIDAGTATGTAGTISLGAANASQLLLGRAGLNVAVQGGLNVAQNLAVDTSTLYVDAANNAVGIGTNAPTAGFQLTVGSNAGSSFINMQHQAGGASAIYFDNAMGGFQISHDSNASTLELLGSGSAITISGGGVSLTSPAGHITVGTSDTTGTMLVLDTKTDAGDPSGTDGAMYYNSDMDRFRCYENGAWINCLNSGNFLRQAPTATADNTITTSTNGVTALTVNGTSGTAATALDVVQAGAATGLQVTSSNTGTAQAIGLTNASGTQAAGMSINRTTAGGTTTSLLSLSQTAGTATNGILFSGTIGTDITTDAGRSMNIVTGTTGTLTLDSGNTGNVNLGTNANAKTINIGTGAAVANTINMGGTGGNTINIGNTQTAGAINLGAAMTTGTITIGGTGLQTGTIRIGTGTGAQAINLGSGTGIKTIAIGGTGGNTIGIGNTQTAGAINMGAAMTTGTISIGGTGAQTGTITIGNGTGAQIINLGTGSSGIKTVNLGTGTAANVISIGTGQNAGSIALGTAMTTGTISIGGTGAQTGTISLGTGTGAQAINLGTGGTGAKTVVLGSTASTGSTTVQSGSGNVFIQAAGAGTGNIQIGTGGAGTNTPDLLVLDAKNNTGDPTGVEGAMYYSQDLNKFRCYQGTAWTDCVGTGGVGDFEATYSADGDKTLSVGTATGFSVDLTSTGNFVVEDNGVTFASFSASGGISFAPQGTEDVAITTDSDSTFRLTGFTQSNGIIYTDATGNFQQTNTGGAGTLCLISTAGGAPTFGSCSGSTSTAWSSITAPSANTSINMNNFTTDFTWGNGNWTNNLNGTGDFIIQDAGTNAFVVTDTGALNLGKSDAGINVTIGDGSASGTPNLLVLDAKNTAPDPGGTEGAMYYNDSTNKFRCYQNTAWIDCSYRTLITLTADDVNNNATANTYEDVIGLTWSVAANTNYRFQCYITYDAAAKTTGSRWSVNGPASPTRLSYLTSIVTSLTQGTGAVTSITASGYNNGTVLTATPATTNNFVKLEGAFLNGANAGTFAIRFASEIANSAITAKAGSTCEVW